jgi:hypothetical protein
MAEQPAHLSIDALARRLRCSVCGARRCVVADGAYRLQSGDGGEPSGPLAVAVVVCQDCGNVKLFVLTQENS